jgi:hypothetical protein
MRQNADINKKLRGTQKRKMADATIRFATTNNICEMYEALRKWRKPCGQYAKLVQLLTEITIDGTRRKYGEICREICPELLKDAKAWRYVVDKGILRIWYTHENETKTESPR